MKFLLAVVVLIMSLPVLAQTTSPSSGSGAPALAVASGITATPAASALVQAAKDLTADQKQYDAAWKTARDSAIAEQKVATKALTDATNALHSKLLGDKKYAAEVKQIDILQTALQKMMTDEDRKFGEETKQLQGRIMTNKTLVQTLMPIVRKEKGLPETSTFDLSTQKWQ